MKQSIIDYLLSIGLKVVSEEIPELYVEVIEVEENEIAIDGIFDFRPITKKEFDRLFELGVKSVGVITVYDNPYMIFTF